MTSADKFVSLLTLTQRGRDVYRGGQPEEQIARVFGGQILAQSIIAAQNTVSDRNIHSLHCYFIRNGDAAAPIDYHVSRTRDGRSFSLRRVEAVQHNHIIFAMDCSFHIEEGNDNHQLVAPEAAPAGTLPSRAEILSTFGDATPPVIKRLLREQLPFEFRFVDTQGMVSRKMRDATRLIWLRAKSPLPNSRALHCAALAYASDLALIDVALHRHGVGLFDGSHQSASLDHSMWFHRPFRADEWLLYSNESPSMAGARGLVSGAFFSRKGEHVASVMQEGLLRKAIT